MAVAFLAVERAGSLAACKTRKERVKVIEIVQPVLLKVSAAVVKADIVKWLESTDKLLHVRQRYNLDLLGFGLVETSWSKWFCTSRGERKY